MKKSPPNISWYNAQSNHYSISNTEELIGLQMLVANGTENFSDKTIALANDVTLTGNWDPIGDGTCHFQGTFDGQGFTISGLSVNGVQYAGLFGYVGSDGQIKNVNVIAAEIKTATTGIQNYAGGLAGVYISSKPIENCRVKVDSIVATASDLKSFAASGGLVGITGTTLNISNSSAKANVSASASGDASSEHSGGFSGGLVGYALNTLAISNSHASGGVSASAYSSSAYSGGLVGYAYETLIIYSSYAINNVLASGHSTFSGGLVGSGKEAIISSSYVSGKISALSNSAVPACAGGIFGFYLSGAMTSVYYNSEGAAQAIGEGIPPKIILGLSSEDLKKQESFIGWDFDKIWGIDSEINNGYPYLRCNVQSSHHNISNVEELKRLQILVANGIENFSNKTITLANDIALTEDWDPIGNSTCPFQGIFDGQGFTISGLSVSGVQYAGLFGYVGSDGQVKNLNVVAAEIKTASTGIQNYAGGLAGVYISSKPIESCNVKADAIIATASDLNSLAASGGLVGITGTPLTISNSSVSGNISTLSSCVACSGGFVGKNEYELTVENCNAKANVSASASNDAYSGGLVGDAYNLVISNSYAIGKVNSNSWHRSAHSGGLAGRSCLLAVSNSSASGSISASVPPSASNYQDTYSGGFVGKNEFELTISNSYASGEASASNGDCAYSGGLEGFGFNDGKLTIKNSYANVKVSASSSKGTNRGFSGGILGSNSNGLTDSVFYNKEEAAKAAGKGLSTKTMGLSNENLKKRESFIGWDFDNIWGIDSETNNGYPYLRSQVLT